MLVQQTVYHVSDRGVLTIGDSPVRCYRRTSLQRIWVYDSQLRQTVAVTIPRDDLIVRPIQPF